jgi:hypothetical protein
VQQVFAVGRNGNQRGFASFRDFADGEILKWGGPGAREERVDSVGSRQDQQDRDQAGDAES